MPCSNPECDNQTVLARGLCAGCYHRQRRGGSLARKNIQRIGVCSEEGCGKPIFARGFCTKHYDANRHPLVTPWKLLRSRWPGEYPEAWASFEAFLADVGDRPSAKHQLRRLDSSKPYSAANVQWVEPIGVGSDMTPEQRSIYERAWRFKRRYGITVEDYDRMLAAQGGVCALCGRPPSQVHRKSGKVRDLAVDHCHEGGHVRALLCTDCNTMLGLAEDSSDRLRAAAAYLERHAKPSDGVALTSMAHPVGPGVGRGHRIKPSSLVTETVMVDTETGKMRLVCDGEAA